MSFVALQADQETKKAIQTMHSGMGKIPVVYLKFSPKNFLSITPSD